LPPSKHRNDRDFEYYWTTQSAIPVSDDNALEVLNDCLKQKPLSDYQNSSSDTKTKETSKQDSSPSESRHDSGSGNGNGKSDGLKLEVKDIQMITEPLQPYYKKGCRNDLALGLSGVLGIACIERLANNDGISDQVDIRKALSVVEETFKKDISIISRWNNFRLNVLLPVTHGYHLARDILRKISAIIRDVQDRGCACNNSKRE